MLGTVLSAVLVGWYTILTGITLLGLVRAKKLYSRGVPPPPDVPVDELPRVTILRPLRGLEPNLFSNLASTFLQSYPASKTTVVFCLESSSDSAFDVVRQVQEAHKASGVESRVVFSGAEGGPRTADEEVEGPNPKIRNLQRAYLQAEAAGDVVWILDSNVLVSPAALGLSIAALRPATGPREGRRKEVGLVHHLPLGVHPSTDLGSRMEACFLGTTHAKMYLAINFTQIDSCVMGKSCMWYTADLKAALEAKRRAGKLVQEGVGLAPFGKYLGEDNMIAHVIFHHGGVDGKGMRHAMPAGVVAGNVVGEMDARSWWDRRIRWIRVRKWMVIASTLIEPLTESLLLSVLLSLSLRHLFQTPLWLPFVLVNALTYTIDSQVYAALLPSSPTPLRPNPPPYTRPHSLLWIKAWVARECAALPVWATAMAGSRVGWRGQDGFRVRVDGTARFLREDEMRETKHDRHKGYMVLSLGGHHHERDRANNV